MMMKNRWAALGLLGLVLVSGFLMGCKHNNGSTSSGVSRSTDSIVTLKGAAQ